MEKRKKSFWWVIIFVLTLGMGTFYAWSVKKGREGMDEEPVKKVVKVGGNKKASRINMIIDLAREKGVIKTSDVREKVGNVTNRTIRRDMDKLESMNIVKKVGNTRGSSYKYVG